MIAWKPRNKQSGNGTVKPDRKISMNFRPPQIKDKEAFISAV